MMFEDIFHLAELVDIKLFNKSTFQALIMSGACDNLEGNRRSQMECVEAAIQWGKRCQADAEKGQLNLF